MTEFPSKSELAPVEEKASKNGAGTICESPKESLKRTAVGEEESQCHRRSFTASAEDPGDEIEECSEDCALTTASGPTAKRHSSSSRRKSIKVSFLQHISPGIGVSDSCDSDADSCSTGSDKERYTKLPPDVLTLLYYSPPISTPLFLAVVIFMMQMAILLLILADIVDFKEGVDLPPGGSVELHVSQFLAILIAVAMQDDLITAINALYQGYSDVPSKHLANRHHGGTDRRWNCMSKGGTPWQWALSIVLRGAAGLLCLGVTFILIMQSEEVTEMFVDFLAVMFVSTLDDAAFILAREGFFGNTIRRETRAASRVQFLQKAGPRWFRPLFFALGAGGMISGWVVIWTNQSHGKYLSCNVLYAQFGDEFYSDHGFYSDIFRFNHMDESGRPVYLTNGAITNGSRPQFAYCADLEAWTFAVAAGRDAVANPCDWLLRTAATDKYDLLEIPTSEWLVSYSQNGGVKEGVPPHYFYIGCGGCKESDQGSCGEIEGTCVSNECVCREGWFGVHCQLSNPCEEIEMDADEGGFGGAEEWPGVYHILRDGNESITVHDHPVYTRNNAQTGDHYVILFAGRRWVAFNCSVIDLLQQPITEKDLAEKLEFAFVVGWPSMVPALVSSPMDVMTPADRPDPNSSLKWYRPYAYSPTMIQKHSSSNLALVHTNVHCTICDDVLNPCRNNGICDEGGQCICENRTYGSLCQVTAFDLCRSVQVSIDLASFDDKITSNFTQYGSLYDIYDISTYAIGHRPVHIGRRGQGAFSFCYGENFWAFVEAEGNDPCSEWTGKSEHSFAYDLTASEGWLFRRPGPIGTVLSETMTLPFIITCSSNDGAL